MKHDDFMDLQLVTLPVERIGSTYRDGELGFPSRLGFLHPHAAAALGRALDVMPGLVLSDAWRAASRSLSRRYPQSGGVRRGVKPPGQSAHNFGLAIDVDLRRTMRAHDCTKKELDETLARYGWYCHRKDHRITHEAWHYNALVTGRGEAYLQHARRSRAPAVEAAIRDLYGHAWEPSRSQLQRYLAFLGHYRGSIDGLVGRRTRGAVAEFQSEWRLKTDGVAGPKTCRVLSLRCAELRHPLTRGLWTVRL